MASKNAGQRSEPPRNVRASHNGRMNASNAVSHFQVNMTMLITTNPDKSPKF
jgi:hypothetical protein